MWLEDRGWLFYLRKRPSSSSVSSWIALQQFIEPGVKHIVEVRQEQRHGEDEESLLAQLLRCFDAETLNPEEIRHYLTVAKRLDLDWQKLYEEALRVQASIRPDQAALLPPLTTVSPPD
jgi:hypothetical protein